MPINDTREPKQERTSLALLGFGLVLIQLHPVRAGQLGFWAVGAAGLMMLVGWLRFRQRRRQIEECRVAVAFG